MTVYFAALTDLKDSSYQIGVEKAVFVDAGLRDVPANSVRLISASIIVAAPRPTAPAPVVLATVRAEEPLAQPLAAGVVGLGGIGLTAVMFKRKAAPRRSEPLPVEEEELVAPLVEMGS